MSGKLCFIYQILVMLAKIHSWLIWKKKRIPSNNWLHCIPNHLFFVVQGPHLQQIINDSFADVNSSSSEFWVMVAALKVTLCIYF